MMRTSERRSVAKKADALLWRRLPARLEDVRAAPPVTQYLLQRFHDTIGRLKPGEFAREPLPRLRVPVEVLTPYHQQDTAAHWKRMLADRYGEHQCPDLPAYTMEAQVLGARQYRQHLRPFGEKALLAAMGARFGVTGWLEAMRGRAEEFRDWCGDHECDPWVGDYDLVDIVQCFADFLDMNATELTARERAAFLDGLETFQAKVEGVLNVLRPDEFPLDSHAFGLACSYAVLGCVLRAYGRAAGQRALDFWSERMLKCWPCFGGDDGGWWMGAAYWKWHLTPILNAVEALRTLGGPDLLEPPFFARTGWFKWYVMPPYARAGGFGDDTHLRPTPHDLAILRYLGVLLKQEELLAYADRTFEPLRGFEVDHGPAADQWMALLLLLRTWDIPYRPARPAPKEPSRVFHDVGIVACHSALGDPERDVMLCFRSGTAGSFGHAHADQNSFFVQAFGEPIFIDAGYYPDYHHPHMKGFAIQTMAHNAVLINNQGQSIRNLHACGQLEHVELACDHDYMVGQCAAAYPCHPQLVRRHLWFQRDPEFPWIFLADHVVLHQPGNMDFLLHSYEQPVWDAARREAEFYGWRVWGTQARARLQVLEPSTVYWHQSNEFPYPADGREIHQPSQWHARLTTVQGAYEQWMLIGIVFRRAAPLNPLYAPAQAEHSPRFSGVAIEGGWKVNCGGVRLRLDRGADRLKLETPEGCGLSKRES